MNIHSLRRSIPIFAVALVLGLLSSDASNHWVALSQNANEIPVNIDWLASPNNCHAPSSDKFKHYYYKSTCFHDAIVGISNFVPRSNRSANECAAWAIHEAMKGDKWRAVAWLAIAQSHNPSAEKVINDNKKAAYDYLMHNYVAVFKDADIEAPGKLSISAQALKVGTTYGEGELEDCVENDAISLVEIPPGLAIIACKDETGESDSDNVCCPDGREASQAICTFGPGIYGPGELGALHDEINYVRVFSQP